MDFWDATKLLIRRWYIAVPLLAATAAATGFVGVAVQPDYVLTSYIQLIPPRSDPEREDAGPRNPWVQLGISSLSQAATYSTQDRTFLNYLADNNFSQNFSITMGYPSPIATIEVVGLDQAQAYATTDEIIRHFEDSVHALQTDYGVLESDLITTRRLDRGENLDIVGGKIKKAMVAVGVAGAVVSVGLTLLIDALLRRRRRGDGGPDAAPSPVPTPSRFAADDAAGPVRPAEAVANRSRKARPDDTLVLASRRRVSPQKSAGPQASATPESPDPVRDPAEPSHDETIMLPLSLGRVRRRGSTEDGRV